jgi:glutamate synthase domain-containing protein 2
VKLIEIKLSQVQTRTWRCIARVKNTPEIAKIRHVEPGKTILSPPGHTAFNSAEGLLKFVQQLRDLSEGKASWI